MHGRTQCACAHEEAVRFARPREPRCEARRVRRRNAGVHGAPESCRCGVGVASRCLRRRDGLFAPCPWCREPSTRFACRIGGHPGSEVLIRLAPRNCPEGTKMSNKTMAKLPTPWKPTKAQLLAAHDKVVPDLIAKNLIVLFAGINPGLYTAAIGRHFGRPGNRFWPALHGGGFTPRLFSPFEGSLLLDLKLASPTSSNVPPPAPMNSRTTNFAPAASVSKPKSNVGVPPSSPSSASAPTASSPASKMPESASKR